jgi:hypothetical protein
MTSRLPLRWLRKLVDKVSAKEIAERSLLIQGATAARALPKGEPIEDLSAVEFRVFSQWGEDGIIEWLVSHVPVPNTRFIEFGVENFSEANCRFLLEHRNWKGLVMDGSERNMAALKSSRLAWMYDLTAMPAFVSAENINTLIEEAGFAGPLGLLSIDIDGNDYWVWKAITAIDPAIVVCEYNPILGDTRPLVVPYDREFRRDKGHYSHLYFGCSVTALQRLAIEKGYSFLGTNANGINAFFVKNELASAVLPLLKARKAFPSRHRDSRNRDGTLSYAGGLDRFHLIEDMPVIDVDTGETLLLRDVDTPYSEAWLKAMD